MADEQESSDAGQERPRTAADRRGQRSRPAPTAPKGRVTTTREQRPQKASLIKRLMLFLREVVAELRKVIWPSRNQLVTYTIVVLVFVSVMVALVALLDFVFGLGVQFVFGT